MKNKGREIMKDQLDLLIFGPGINTYNRFTRFLEVQHLLRGWKFWHLLRRAYECSDGLYLYRTLIKEFFTRDEPEKEFLMEPEERAFLASLDPVVTIHRGMSIAEKESGDLGVSWTLSRQKAEDFAYTYAKVHGTPEEITVVSLVVHKGDVMAYFSGSKLEIIYIQNSQK